jgi:hypothetical protein
MKKEYTLVGRPGYFGKQRDRIFEKYDLFYGKGNWEIGWVFGENLTWDNDRLSIRGEYQLLEFPENCKPYEESYYQYFANHRSELEWITNNYKDVFDNSPTNVNSRLDYTKQEKGIGTHIQDIAIRNVVNKFGLKFQGEGLLQVRTGVGGPGENWSPMNIPFYETKWIMQPKLNGWWDKGVPDSVECWYQSNKVLMAKHERKKVVLEKDE